MPLKLQKMADQLPNVFQMTENEKGSEERGKTWTK
jgi:hypothetical protein